MYTDNSNFHNWPWMHSHPTNQQQPLPPPLFVDLFVTQQLPESHAKSLPRCECRIWHSYSSLFCIRHVYQGMAQQYRHQYRAPSSGPSRNQHSKGVRKTEAQYAYHIAHESSGTIARDHSTSTHPGHARRGKDNTGAGRALTPPSRNPSMVDHNSTQQTRIIHNKRYRHPRSRKSRTDKVDPSMYEIPITNLESGSSIPAVMPALSPHMHLRYQRIGHIDIDVPFRAHRHKFECTRTVS